MVKRIVFLVMVTAYCAILYGCASEQNVAVTSGKTRSNRPSLEQYMKSNEDEAVRETAGRF